MRRPGRRAAAGNPPNYVYTEGASPPGLKKGYISSDAQVSTGKGKGDARPGYTASTVMQQVQGGNAGFQAPGYPLVNQTIAYVNNDAIAAATAAGSQMVQKGGKFVKQLPSRAPRRVSESEGGKRKQKELDVTPLSYLSELSAAEIERVEKEAREKTANKNGSLEALHPQHPRVKIYTKKSVQQRKTDIVGGASVNAGGLTKKQKTEADRTNLDVKADARQGSSQNSDVTYEVLLPGAAEAKDKNIWIQNGKYEYDASAKPQSKHVPVRAGAKRKRPPQRNRSPKSVAGKNYTGVGGAMMKQQATTPGNIVVRSQPGQATPNGLSVMGYQARGVVQGKNLNRSLEPGQPVNRTFAPSSNATQVVQMALHNTTGQGASVHSQQQQQLVEEQLRTYVMMQQQQQQQQNRQQPKVQQQKPNSVLTQSHGSNPLVMQNQGASMRGPVYLVQQPNGVQAVMLNPSQRQSSPRNPPAGTNQNNTLSSMPTSNRSTMQRSTSNMPQGSGMGTSSLPQTVLMPTPYQQQLQQDPRYGQLQQQPNQQQQQHQRSTQLSQPQQSQQRAMQALQQQQQQQMGQQTQQQQSQTQRGDNPLVQAHAAQAQAYLMMQSLGQNQAVKNARRHQSPQQGQQNPILLNNQSGQAIQTLQNTSNPGSQQQQRVYVSQGPNLVNGMVQFQGNSASPDKVQVFSMVPNVQQNQQVVSIPQVSSGNGDQVQYYVVQGPQSSTAQAPSQQPQSSSPQIARSAGSSTSYVTGTGQGASNTPGSTMNVTSSASSGGQRVLKSSPQLQGQQGHASFTAPYPHPQKSFQAGELSSQGFQGQAGQGFVVNQSGGNRTFVGQTPSSSALQQFPYAHTVTYGQNTQNQGGGQQQMYVQNQNASQPSLATWSNNRVVPGVQGSQAGSQGSASAWNASSPAGFHSGPPR